MRFVDVLDNGELLDGRLPGGVEHGLELSRRDRDFKRWADLGLRTRDPVT